MPDRGAVIEAFLRDSRWATAVHAPLAGDASARRYLRLTLPASGEACVLMDAPPGRAGSVGPFVEVARILSKAGFSAPQILTEDRRNGLLLIEDFGDALFARLIDRDAKREAGLYDAAVDVLVRLNSAKLPGELPQFTAAEMARQALLVFRAYAHGEGDGAAFLAEMETLLDRHTSGPEVLILRDFHAENLVWLPRRQGIRRVGLLDFQDSMAGPVGYDLVSLLYDARRDVPGLLTDRLIAHFAAELGLDHQAFGAACAVLSAQRNLRILGVFARLSLQRGKSGYLPLIPRVWTHLQDALRHPALAPLKRHVANLPVPCRDHLDTLRPPCDAIRQ